MHILGSIPVSSIPPFSRVSLGIALAVGFLSGCEISINSQTEITGTVPLTELSQDTTTPIFTTRHIPASIPSETATPTASPSATSVPTPTFTPLPTLADAQAQAEILDLLKNNAGCKLPCWWGITPGETTWQEAIHFLQSLSPRIVRWGQGEITTETINRSGGFNIYLDVPEYIRQKNNLYMSFPVSENIIYRIITHATIPLSELLTTYGKPSEVWVRVDPNALYFDLPFVMAIYYPEQYIIATYYDEIAVYSRQGYIYGCFDKNLYFFNNPTLSLWSPGIELSWQNIDPLLHMNAIPSLEEAIGMDIETFYQTYKDPNKRPCVESPEGLWERFRFVEQ